jgi:hypothetical protein
MQVQPSTSTRRSAAADEEDGNPVRRALQRVDRSLDELEADAPPLVEAVWAVSNSPIAHAAGKGVTAAAKVCLAMTAYVISKRVALLLGLPHSNDRARLDGDRLAEKLLCWRSLWASGRCSAASALRWAPLQQGVAAAAAAADQRKSRVPHESWLTILLMIDLAKCRPCLIIYPNNTALVSVLVCKR